MRSHCNRSRAGAAGVAALAFAALMPVSAAADPAVNPAAAALDRHQQGVEAFNAHHVEAVADIYAEDATCAIRKHPNRSRVGRPSARRMRSCSGPFRTLR